MNNLNNLFLTNLQKTQNHDLVHFLTRNSFFSAVLTRHVQFYSNKYQGMTFVNFKEMLNQFKD